MKLTTVRIRDFRSIRDSNECEIGDITCLVGKNESGKTTLLQALYRLNPIIEADAKYDITDDYPRCEVEDYRLAVEEGKKEHAIVCEAKFCLEEDEITVINNALGDNILNDKILVLKRSYENKICFSLNINEGKAIKGLVKKAQIPTEMEPEYASCPTFDSLLEKIKNNSTDNNHLLRLSECLKPIKESEGISNYVFKLISNFIPKFLYFDEYYQMRGHENINALKNRVKQNNLKDHDRPLLGLIELARLDIDQLLNPRRTQDLKNKLEAAGNHLTKKGLKYWSQNNNLSIRFDVRQGQPEDIEGMREGMNIWAEIYDSKHWATTSLGRRSRGFIWFFSFLAFFEQQKKKNIPIILLLDEPGLSLHGKAQGDLLRYIEKELQNNHQIIYTTHSPFMVDPCHFERVRIVQDMGMDNDKTLTVEEDGTKVISDVLLATEDTLFPLQGALGYELHQTLFVGPSCLLVEGVSDLLYLQTISGILSRKGRTALSEKWTITPIGGAGRLPTFVSLMGSQKNMKIVTLLDIDSNNQQMLNNLMKQRLIEREHVITFGDFINRSEADIEDLFDRMFYVDLFNKEFATELKSPVREEQLGKQPRILTALKLALKNTTIGNDRFNHYRPARYFAEHVGEIEDKLLDTTLDRFDNLFSKLNGIL